MNTRNLNLPTWDEGNNEPDLVFNQLLLAMDALAKSPVEAIEPTPPGMPEQGQAWIVGEDAVGAWEGHDDDVAVAVTGGSGWIFFTPMPGWAFWVLDPGATYRYLAGAWSPTGGGALTNPMTGLGDMIYGDVDGEPLRVPAGTVGQVPTVQSDGSIAFENVGAGTSLGSAVTALSIVSGTATADCSLGDYFTLSLTANATLALSNEPTSGIGRTVMFRIRQDATGGRTLALPSDFKPMAGSDTSIQSSANAYTVIVATSVDGGTRWEYAMKAGGA